MDEVVVASFNVHGGVDGFGRPFDIIGSCREIDADVLILQESWSPAEGEPLARVVGEALGYRVEELAMTAATVAAAPENSGPPDSGSPNSGSPNSASRASGKASSWGPVLVARGPWGLRVGDGPEGRRRPAGTRGVDRGTWGIALLSRVPVTGTATLDLGQLRRDPARRGAIAVEVALGGRTLRIIGTHLSHLSHGSLFQLRALERLISRSESPAVLMGDMNMWGPPLSGLLPGWRRVVRGRTWPAWRPVAQLDHILATAGVATVGRGQVLGVRGSDHLPVRARLRLA